MSANQGNMTSYFPEDLKVSQLHALLLSSVAPRPIAFASTLSADGQPNLSPFSFFNVFSANPPIFIFSPARRVRDNTTKHTRNTLEHRYNRIGRISESSSAGITLCGKKRTHDDETQSVRTSRHVIERTSSFGLHQ